ncbi:TetR/AcrR family transcriptional regulator [Kitasatospora phosalacinea]|uniref:TetR family transcriptional regulator n=1 Tax=Kitasatospora phosalacinea TaxID=2065 RepID=A0A9W6PQA1_9ACTN|nr:TetR/AcrR family transcriptional regulator [Kitasatospora phosalacinea]GLW59335.1 TetR family transcriptional regulator [Kitasatospora phosalacinea]
MGRTFIESARRRQIVGAAIEVIADSGYGKASFARIAKQAGLSSTGMISYHFEGKDDLLREVVTEVLRVLEEYTRPRIDAETGLRARMRAYIESNVELAAAHPRELAALVEILNGHGDGDGEGEGGGGGGGGGAEGGQVGVSRRAVLERQERVVREAQADGEFGSFDARVLVTAMRGAIDALLVRLLREPGADVAASARELADLFDRAVFPAAAEPCMAAHRLPGAWEE